MREDKIRATVRAFEAVEKAQEHYQQTFDELTEAEEAEFEKRLMTQGVKITLKSKDIKSEKP